MGDSSIEWVSGSRRWRKILTVLFAGSFVLSLAAGAFVLYWLLTGGPSASPISFGRFFVLFWTGLALLFTCLAIQKYRAAHVLGFSERGLILRHPIRLWSPTYEWSRVRAGNPGQLAVRAWGGWVSFPITPEQDRRVSRVVAMAAH